MTSDQLLERIFDADRQADAAENELLQAQPASLATCLRRATDVAIGLQEPPERIRRLRRLADLSAQVPSGEMIDNLITILDSEEAVTRLHAGEALLDVAYERYADFARGVERLLQRAHKGPCMSELPFVVAEIGEPSAVALISGFLNLDDSEAVASAIEALAVVGDPAARPYLEPLLNDQRTVTLHDEQDEPMVRIAELAAEALEALSAEQLP